MVSHPWQILHSTTPDEDHRMLLKIVPHTRDIRRYLDAVGQTDSRNFPQSRVGLFGCRSVNSDTDTPFLRTIPQRGSPGFPLCCNPRTMKQLIDRRHSRYSSCLCKTRPCKLIGIITFVKGFRPKIPFYALAHATEGRERQRRRQATPAFGAAHSTRSTE